ncbi:hypothetical protein ETU10_07215 [Apibacter muscae]|uniref:hypothetical protein n=1 Tax=Apibacter muscae TaxID=2509004 RepID=UPI0011ACB777|nr:hypothetical protein [Apibacter muscae]TWP23505.1 hypothetical protein ETU10_07215 [Apibacter muscae]
MKTITTQQTKQIFGLFPKHLSQNKEERADFIYHFTDKRVSSTKELTYQEADNLICFLKGDYSYYAKFDNKNHQHAKILSLCYQLGWVSFNKKSNKVLVSLKTLGKWLHSEKSPVRKPLQEMSTQECRKIIHALENIRNKTT